MVTRVSPISLAATMVAGAMLPLSAGAADIRVMCYQDGIECTVTAELAKKFEAQNAGTKVIIDVVPYKTIVEQLPVQLAAGQGPDIARVTDLGGVQTHLQLFDDHPLHIATRGNLGRGHKPIQTQQQGHEFTLPCGPHHKRKVAGAGIQHQALLRLHPVYRQLEARKHALLQ